MAYLTFTNPRTIYYGPGALESLSTTSARDGQHDQRLPERRPGRGGRRRPSRFHGADRGRHL